MAEAAAVSDKKNKKFMEQLLKLSGAVSGNEDVHSYVIRSPSPSLNFTFGNGHGLPAGFTLTLYGPPKGGKTVVSNAMTGQLHRDDPDAWVIKFDTEFRDKAQLTAKDKVSYGIDDSRYMCFQVNAPDEIFDRIEKDLAALVENGMKLKLVIIDSLADIMGRRQMNAEGVMTQQRGDKAATIQEGLQRILAIQRRLGFSLIIIAQIRAEQDEGEIMRGKKFRPAMAFAAQHHSEYTMWVERFRFKGHGEDLLGQKYENTDVEDLRGKAEATGHRVLVRMEDSSFGPKGRQGEFTIDYKKGIVATHEEVFRLGVGWKIITRPNNLVYGLGGRKFTGKAAMLEALQTEPALCEEVLTELRRRDNLNEFKTVDAPVNPDAEAE